MPSQGLVRHRFAAVSLSLVLLVEAGAVAPPTAAHTGSPAVDAPVPELQSNRPIEPATEVPPASAGPESRGAPVELPEKRTPDSRTFLNPDGTYTTQLFGTPIHYQASDGTLQPIEAVPVAGRSEGVAFETKSGPVLVELGTSSAGPELLSVTADGATVSLRPVTSSEVAGIAEPAARAPSADGRQVTYRDVYPGVDLRYTLLDAGVKEDIILTVPGTATTFAWVMDTSGLAAELQPDGSILIGAKDSPVYIIPAPFMVDSAPEGDGDGARSLAVHFRLDTKGSETILTLEADRDWIADAARVFPIYVDPTTLQYFTNIDTFISSAHPTTSFNTQWNANEGGYWEMWNGRYDATSGTNYAFSKMILPADVTVLSADFKIYVQHAWSGGTPTSIFLGKLTSAFTTSQTWNMTHPSWTAYTSTTVADNCPESRNRDTLGLG